jgi:hypothetical protein
VTTLRMGGPLRQRKLVRTASKSPPRKRTEPSKVKILISSS